jgi:hypothetical protein
LPQFFVGCRNIGKPLGNLDRGLQPLVSQE